MSASCAAHSVGQKDVTHRRAHAAPEETAGCMTIHVRQASVTEQSLASGDARWPTTTAARRSFAITLHRRSDRELRCQSGFLASVSHQSRHRLHEPVCQECPTQNSGSGYCADKVYDGCTGVSIGDPREMIARIHDLSFGVRVSSSSTRAMSANGRSPADASVTSSGHNTS